MTRNIIIALAAVALSGCLISTQQRNIVEPDETRAAAEFESAESLAAFRAEVDRRYRTGDAVESRSGWGIPLLYSNSETTELSRPAFYNEQLAIADANADGLISNAESAAYAQR